MCEGRGWALGGCWSKSFLSRRNTNLSASETLALNCLFTFAINEDLSVLPLWLSGKETTYQCKRPGFKPRVGEGDGNPIQNYCLDNSMDKRSLAGYSPWGHKELDMTEHPTLIFTGRA